MFPFWIDFPAGGLFEMAALFAAAFGAVSTFLLSGHH